MAERVVVYSATVGSGGARQSTDGEGRDLGLVADLARLASRRTTAADVPGVIRAVVEDLDVATDPALDAAARSLTSVMLDGALPEDDVCVLLVAPQPSSGLHRRFQSDPRALAEIRRALRDWCAGVGLVEQHTDDVVLVAGEALANAVEHGYAGREPGPVVLDADLADDGAVLLRIRDQGAWRRPFAAGLRGRGTHLMRSLSSSFAVDRMPTGTTVRATVRPPAADGTRNTAADR